MAENSQGENPPTLREQGGEVVSDLRQVLLHTTSHFEALAELLQLELEEYARGQFKRLVAIVLSAALLGCAYLLLCVWAVVELSPHIGLRWAFIGVALFNVVVGLVALIVGARCKPAGVAPATMQEIKNDVRCVQLYLKERHHS